MSKTAIYREVKISDRLPKKQDIYFTIKNNGDKGTALRTDDSVYYDGEKRPLMDSRNMYDKNTSIWLEEIKLPTETQIKKAVKELAQKSTAPDKETPDWMEADILRGIKWALNYYTQTLTDKTDNNDTQKS